MRAKAFGLCAVTTAGFVAASASAQIWCEDFDDYATGLLVGQDCILGDNCDGVNGCPEGNSWQAWDFNPNWGRSVVVDDPSRSASNSVQISAATADDLIHTYRDLNLTTGVYAYEAWQFIPTDADNGVTWFNLFNNYDGRNPNHQNPDWSMATQFNMATGEVLAWADGGTLPMLKGEWVQIRVVINLTGDTQEIYYNGDLLVSKTWSGGVAEGGLTELQAVDLFAASGTVPVYYDDISITELPPLGACCFADDQGTCTDGQDPTVCTDAGGVFQGFGSECFAGRCPVLGANGWEVTAPFTWDGSSGRNDTCDAGANCEKIYEGNDIQFEVTIPWPSNWTFSTAGSELLDTELLIGTGGLCSADLVDDGGCVPGPSCSGDQDSEGNQAVFTLGLSEDTSPVNVNIEEFSGECGKITLSVSAPCPQLALPAGDPENETCGVRENDGCNMDKGMEQFSPLELGQAYVGESFLQENGVSRDTDWWELTLDEDTTVRLTFKSEFGGTGVTGIIAYNEGSEGSGDCADITGFISPFGTYNRCAEYPGEGDPVEIVADLVAGTWWFFVGPAFGATDFNCDEDPGKDYWILVEEVTTKCTPAPDGDVFPFPGGDGVTDFDDLLLVLNQWDEDGSNGGDCDCNGIVEFDDLLKVLSGWD